MSSSEEPPNLEEELKKLDALKEQLEINMKHIISHSRRGLQLHTMIIVGICTVIGGILVVEMIVFDFEVVSVILLSMFLFVCLGLFAWLTISCSMKIRFNSKWNAQDKLEKNIADIEVCKNCILCLLGQGNYNNKVNKLVSSGFKPVYGANLDNQIMHYYLDKRSKIPGGSR